MGEGAEDGERACWGGCAVAADECDVCAGGGKGECAGEARVGREDAGDGERLV